MALFISHSREETIRFGEEYAKTLRAGDTVLIDGEMGAGKTVLTKGILKGLGVQEEVTSPTYAYVNTYCDKFFHFDCYRIESEEQAFRLGFADYFELGGVCLVEWGENIKGLLPEGCKRIVITKRGEELREITY